MRMRFFCKNLKQNVIHFCNISVLNSNFSAYFTVFRSFKLQVRRHFAYYVAEGNFISRRTVPFLSKQNCFHLYASGGTMSAFVFVCESKSVAESNLQPNWTSTFLVRAGFSYIEPLSRTNLKPLEGFCRRRTVSFFSRATAFGEAESDKFRGSPSRTLRDNLVSASARFDRASPLRKT